MISLHTLVRVPFQKIQCLLVEVGDLLVNERVRGSLEYEHFGLANSLAQRGGKAGADVTTSRRPKVMTVGTVMRPNCELLNVVRLLNIGSGVRHQGKSPCITISATLFRALART